MPELMKPGPCRPAFDWLDSLFQHSCKLLAASARIILLIDTIPKVKSMSLPIRDVQSIHALRSSRELERSPAPPAAGISLSMARVT
jgi:hypothetical protein